MTKKESAQIKGIAILMMFWQHLFGCDTYLSNGEALSYIPVFGTFDTVIGVGAKLCVPIFAFISGYGLYKSYISSNNSYSAIIKNIFKFLSQYWTILFLIGIPYLIFFNKFNPKYLFINLFSIFKNDEILYVSLSWYVKVNLLFLIFCPLLKYFSKKVNFLEEIFFFIVFPIIVTFYLVDYESGFNGHIRLFSSSFRLLCVWLPIFYLGIIFSKYSLLEKCRYNVNMRKTIWSVLVSFLCFLSSLIIRSSIGYNEIIVVDLFCTITVIISVYYIFPYISNCKVIDNILFYLGKYSFQLWLLSGMFFLNTTEFLWVLYLPKYSILILIWSIALLFPLAVLLKKLSLLIYYKVSAGINLIIQKVKSA